MTIDPSIGSTEPNMVILYFAIAYCHRTSDSSVGGQVTRQSCEAHTHRGEQRTLVCKAEGPQPEVGGSVGYGPQAVLNGVDGGEHQNLTRSLLWRGEVDNVSYGGGKWTTSVMEGKVDNVSYGGGKWTM